MPSREEMEEMMELAKLSSLVNGEMNSIASKTDPDKREFIPIRKIDPRKFFRPNGQNNNGGVTMETIPVNPNDLPPHLRPMSIDQLMIPQDTSSAGGNPNSPVGGQTPIPSPENKTNDGQLELGLSFEKETPFSALSRMISDLNQRLNRIENKINILVERKTRRGASEKAE